MRTLACGAAVLLIAACAQRATLPGGGGSGDPPLECGFELANASMQGFERIESVPVLLLEAGLRPGEARRIEVSCAPACYAFRATSAAGPGAGDGGPERWTQVVARPQPTRWVRVELRAPDPFARDVGLWGLARESGCVAAAAQPPWAIASRNSALLV